MLNAQTLRWALVGGVIGVVATVVVGFSALGWMRSGTAEHLAAQRSDAAIVKVLTPICVERFQSQDDYAAKLHKLKDTAVWQRYVLVEENGWAKIPGTDETHSALAKACAEKIGELS